MIKPPVVGWIHGHIHERRVKYINDIPIMVNANTHKTMVFNIIQENEIPYNSNNPNSLTCTYVGKNKHLNCLQYGNKNCCICGIQRLNN